MEILKHNHASRRRAADAGEAPISGPRECIDVVFSKARHPSGRAAVGWLPPDTAPVIGVHNIVQRFSGRAPGEQRFFRRGRVEESETARPIQPHDRQTSG